MFIATLPAGQGSLRDMLPGSRLRITGVCDDETSAASPEGGQPTKAQLLTSLKILLRSPQDVAVLSGPPWWTLRRTVILVVTLLTVILGSLLWVHLLQRRLERQRAAQLAFSRQVLERLEDERRQIAANLHDSLGQILLAIKNQALLAIQRPPDERACGSVWTTFPAPPPRPSKKCARSRTVCGLTSWIGWASPRRFAPRSIGPRQTVPSHSPPAWRTLTAV